MPTDLVKVLVSASVTFVVGLLITPIVAHYLYKHKAWKKKGGKTALDGSEATEFKRLHADTGIEVRAPRMGGIVIWGSVLAATLGLASIAALSSNAWLHGLGFLTRSQTWIPLATLMVGACAGLVDDLLMIRSGGEGIRLRYRLLIVLGLSSYVGWWFWAKVGVVTVGIPFVGALYVGWFIVPLFILVSLALYASGVIDGIDGLSGGVFASIFASYAIIAYELGQVDLAAFCTAVVGGLIAFLWFNIPPARFYMTDTGSMALTLTIAVIAFMTDSMSGGVGIAVLPIIGALLVATVASNVLQVFWKKFFHKKLLRIAPLHHHFEAIGWPGYKVTMRYWILSVILAVIGVIIALSAAQSMNRYDSPVVTPPAIV